MISSGQFSYKVSTLEVKASNLQSNKLTLYLIVDIRLYWFLKSTSSHSSTTSSQLQLSQGVTLPNTKSSMATIMFTAATRWILDLYRFWWLTIGSQLTLETLFGTRLASTLCVVYLCAKMIWTSSYLDCLCSKDTTWLTVWLILGSHLFLWLILSKVSFKMELFLPNSLVLTLSLVFRNFKIGYKESWSRIPQLYCL